MELFRKRKIDKQEINSKKDLHERKSHANICEHLSEDKFHIHGALEKRLTHMPFTHAFTGSNPVRVTIEKIRSETGAFLFSI